MVEPETKEELIYNAKTNIKAIEREIAMIKYELQKTENKLQEARRNLEHVASLCPTQNEEGFTDYLKFEAETALADSRAEGYDPTWRKQRELQAITILYWLPTLEWGT